MRFRNLGSGSGGNATLVEASQGITTTRVLVDAGFSERELMRRLALAGCTPADVDAIFITHEHGDHVGRSVAFARRHRIPLITSRGTWRAIGCEDFDASLLCLARSGEPIALGDLELQPFAVPHDAHEPLQLCLGDGAMRLGIITDLGSAPAAVADALRGCHALLLECNHDEAMLMSGPYPPSLQRRILGTHGHLSNEAAAELLSRCWHQALNIVVAAHLSEKNNSPMLARSALAPVLNCAADDIRVAHPVHGFDWLAVD
jgi:phosphoribosyl 1,2-cyclic phosphodiesterase